VARRHDPPAIALDDTVAFADGGQGSRQRDREILRSSAAIRRCARASSSNEVWRVSFSASSSVAAQSAGAAQPIPITPLIDALFE
jgi:hypothetical protein